MYQTLTRGSRSCRAAFAAHREGGVARSSASREDVYGAVFEDVDLDAGLFGDGLDFLSARANEVADLVGRDVELVEARRVSRNLRARGVKRRFHGIQNLEARFFRLCERLPHPGKTDAKDLDVHLQRVDAVARAGDFEVHIAVMIFGAGNVGEDGIFAFVPNDEPHGDART